MSKNRKQTLVTMTSLAEQLIRAAALCPSYHINVSVMFFQQDAHKETFYSKNHMSQFGAIIEINTAMEYLGVSENTKRLVFGLIEKELHVKGEEETKEEPKNESV